MKNRQMNIRLQFLYGVFSYLMAGMSEKVRKLGPSFVFEAFVCHHNFINTILLSIFCRHTSSTLAFLISRSFNISWIHLSSVWTSIDGDCEEAGSDSKYGFPRRLSASTRIRRTWFRVVSDTKFSLEYPSAFLVVSVKAWNRSTSIHFIKKHFLILRYSI